MSFVGGRLIAEFVGGNDRKGLVPAELAMAAAIARARRSQSLLRKLVLPQSSYACTYHSCGLASSSRRDAFDSSARSRELSLWRNYLRGLVSVRTMATFNRK